MAAPTAVDNVELLGVPWLVRRMTVTSGDTATEIAHGGPTSTRPDVVYLVQTNENPVASGWSWLTSSDDSNIKLDF